MEISIPSLLRIKPNAIFKIGKYLRKAQFTRIALFFGESMKEIVGERIFISLDSSEIGVVHQEVIANNDAADVFNSTFALPRTTQAIVAVGGGKVIDYAKYVAFINQIPIISIPTSVSNDGFSSPMASLTINGKRQSLKARIPHGVIIDTNIIKASPKRFTLSGIGDLVSKVTAIYDWKLSYHQTHEPVNDFAVLISMNSVENLIGYPNKDIDDLEFLRLLCGALVMSGVAMEVSGSSRPASGAEHLISHAYDKLAKAPTLHGIQVGVATYAVAWLQKNDKLDVVRSVLENTGFAAYVRQNPLSREDFIAAIRYAPNVKENYHTILSEKDSVERLMEFVGSDPYFCQFLSDSAAQ